MRDVHHMLAAREAPIAEGAYRTFVYRGDADEAWLVQRIVGLPGRIPLQRVPDTDLWYAVLEVEDASRIEYQFEVRHGEHIERGNDPLNGVVADSPFGSTSVCFGPGYTTPDWVRPDSAAAPGELTDLVVASRAFDRGCDVTMYLPPRFRRDAAYPLLVVHDGGDFLRYAAAKVVLDNLIHRRDIADVVVAFLHPADRLTEYTHSTAHARFLSDELVPRLETEFPLSGDRCLLGASFGAVASLSAATLAPRTYGSLVLLSGSFVFSDHGGGPVFDPVVEFVNGYRHQPTRVASRVYVSCGQYEPLVFCNRAMLPILRSTGMEVRYVEVPDGHSWGNWRDRLRDALTWVAPGGDVAVVVPLEQVVEPVSAGPAM